MDFQIYKAIDAKGPDFLHSIFKFFATDAVVLIVIGVALLFLIPWRVRRADRRRAAVAATAAGHSFVIAYFKRYSGGACPPLPTRPAAARPAEIEFQP